MKWLGGLLPFLLACFVSSGSGSDLASMYQAAYRYIEADSALRSYCRDFLEVDAAGCTLAVADSTIFMEYAMYASKIAESTEGEDLLATIESIVRRDRDRAQTFESIPVGSFLKLDKSREGAAMGLFFSNPLDDVLMARVVGHFSVGKSFRELAQFNTGVTYLFFFNEDGTVQRVVSGVTHYD